MKKTVIWSGVISPYHGEALPLQMPIETSSITGRSRNKTIIDNDQRSVVQCSPVPTTAPSWSESSPTHPSKGTMPSAVAKSALLSGKTMPTTSRDTEHNKRLIKCPGDVQKLPFTWPETGQRLADEQSQTFPFAGEVGERRHVHICHC
jgi:hypothetical protein